MLVIGIVGMSACSATYPEILSSACRAFPFSQSKSQKLLRNTVRVYPVPSMPVRSIRVSKALSMSM